jgi:hypothetical protein
MVKWLDCDPICGDRSGDWSRSGGVAGVKHLEDLKPQILAPTVVSSPWREWRY